MKCGGEIQTLKYESQLSDMLSLNFLEKLRLTSEVKCLRAEISSERVRKFSSTLGVIQVAC